MHTTARILSCCCLLLFFSGPCIMLNGQTLNSSGELVISTDVGTDVVNISIVGNESKWSSMALCLCFPLQTGQPDRVYRSKCRYDSE